MLSTIKGSFIIAQTPFDERGAVNLASIDRLTDFYLGHGADGFVVLGVSGEGGKLTPEEAQQVSTASSPARKANRRTAADFSLG
jgi:4-hydroxy-tetrahydrodipicolinate synthase